MKTKIILSSLFAVAVFVCYGVFHPEWFNYHEQYQMYMFGWDYLAEHLAVSSGFADYLAEFVVQFYFFPLLGAALWAGLLVLIGWLLWRVARVLGFCADHYAVFLLPPLLLTIYCGDINVMMAFPMSVVLALAAVLLYAMISGRRRFYWQFLMVPAVYWLAGYGVVVYAALAWGIDRQKFRVSGYNVIAAPVIYIIGILAMIVLVGYTVMRQYHFSDIIFGVDFYRDRLVVPVMQHVVAASVIMVPWVAVAVGRLGRFLSMTANVVLLAVLLLASLKIFDKSTYFLLKLDYYVRFQEWQKVIDLCEDNPTLCNDQSCTGINLALAMTNQMPDRMFDFLQTGQNGLLSRFSYDMVSCAITAEACYHLGLVNEVLRYNYDSQAAIVNCNKSGRFTRRIAEAYMLNGNYELATKYLDLLKKTVFYSPWAHKAEAACHNPALIAQDKRWSRILRYRIPKGQLWSVTDMESMLWNLYKQSSGDNRIALHYSLACAMLNGKFRQFVDMLAGTASDAPLPRNYQEALAYIYLTQKGSLEDAPAVISPEVKAGLAEFNRLYVSNKNHPALQSGPLSRSYWRYVMFGR